MDTGLLEAELEVGGIRASDMMTGESESSVTMVSSDTWHEATPNDPSLNSPESTSVLPTSSNSTAAVGSISNTDDQFDDDMRQCTEFIQRTCGCIKFGGKPCSSQFSAEYYLERRAQASLLTRSELDMVLLGSIMTTVQQSDNLIHGRHKPEKRKRAHTTYMHNGTPVCQVTFGFIFGIGRKHKITNIRNHYLENGIATRVHKNSLLRPHNALSFDETTHLVKFLENYAEQHAILLPGRIPGYKRDDIKLLPSSTSKMVGTIICVGV